MNRTFSSGLLVILISLLSLSFTQLAKESVFQVDASSPVIHIPIKERFFNEGKGSSINGYYWFKNTGTAPLIISKASGSGGSTCPNYSRVPVAPGDWHYIAIKYDSNRLGPFRRTSTVTCNDTNLRIFPLKIKGIITNKAATPYHPLSAFTKISILDHLIDSSAIDLKNHQYIAVINRDTIPHYLWDTFSKSDSAITSIIPVKSYPVLLKASDTTYLPISLREHVGEVKFKKRLSFITDENLEEPFATKTLKYIKYIDDYAEITFDSTMLTRQLHQNETTIVNFHFRNTGSRPLVIIRAIYSDGIFIASHPKGPILPNDTGIISLKCKTQRLGNYSSNIVIKTNAYNGNAYLRLKGEVLE